MERRGEEKNGVCGPESGKRTDEERSRAERRGEEHKKMVKDGARRADKPGGRRTENSR